ncbi:MAG: hypothetical protein JWM11_4075 [Planctomycetaceae bacterium]|nr:hypothetical protein [Planctomycetaceae bacterium]
MSTTPPAAGAVVTPAHHKSEVPERIFLVSHPKIIFLYPTLLVSLLAGIILMLGGDSKPGDPPGHWEVALTGIFLAVLTVNLIVFSFDFPRTTSLTLVFFIAAAVLGIILFLKYQPQWFGIVGDWIKQVRPTANSTFYNLFSLIMAGIYLTVFINLQFDYWEARPNELLHHHGMWSDLQRFPAPNLRIEKEINDVFEYILLGSGRLVLHPSNEPRAIVLDNVLLINRKEQALTRMLSAMQVQIRTDN